MAWIPKPSGCTRRSFQQPLEQKLCLWLISGLYLECFLALMRQSGLSPWSGLKAVGHNLAAGPTYDERMTRGEKSLLWLLTRDARSKHKRTWRTFCVSILGIALIGRESSVWKINKAFTCSGCLPNSVTLLKKGTAKQHRKLAYNSTGSVESFVFIASYLNNWNGHRVFL